MKKIAVRLGSPSPGFFVFLGFGVKAPVEPERYYGVGIASGAVQDGRNGEVMGSVIDRKGRDAYGGA